MTPSEEKLLDIIWDYVDKTGKRDYQSIAEHLNENGYPLLTVIDVADLAKLAR